MEFKWVSNVQLFKYKILSGNWHALLTCVLSSVGIQCWAFYLFNFNLAVGIQSM